MRNNLPVLSPAFHHGNGKAVFPGRDASDEAGTIGRQVWTINYQFGKEQGREFLEYFSTHRMTNDTLHRIWDDGTVEVLGGCQEFFLADDPQAAQAYYEHNRRFYQMVREKGLL